MISATQESTGPRMIPWASDALDALVRLLPKLRPDSWAPSLGDRPADNTLGIVAAASVLFYRAERGHNPKVNDIWDALVYCSTCISVGYADIFPRTPVGKIIGSLLMTLGPAMAAKTLEGHSGAAAESVQRKTLVTLEAILAELKSGRGSLTAGE